MIKLAYNNRTVAENLRAKNKVLKDKLETTKKIVKEMEQPNPFKKGKHNDWLHKLRKHLGVEHVSE